MNLDLLYVISSVTSSPESVSDLLYSNKFRIESKKTDE